MVLRVDYKDWLAQVINKMSHGGVFLTARAHGKTNTMTIGWGGITYYWKHPVFEVPVRESRYTRELIEESGVFTVSVPLQDEDMSSQLAYCGSHSGRDVNKYEECGLELEQGQKVDVPVVKGCSLHFECEVVLKTQMQKEHLLKEIDERWYPDYHTMYYGKIVDCYLSYEEKYDLKER